MTPPSKHPRLSYGEAAVAGATPLRLVILLYEQAIADLQRALSAQQNGDIEGRTRHTNHAILVIGHLQGSLDREQGGEVARNLDRFYDQMRAGLMEALTRQSASLLERRIADFLLVHEAWCAVERLNQLDSPVAPGTHTATSSAEGWNA